MFGAKLCVLGDFQPVSVLVNSNLFGTIIHLGFHVGSTPGSASWQVSKKISLHHIIQKNYPSICIYLVGAGYVVVSEEVRYQF